MTTTAPPDTTATEVDPFDPVLLFQQSARTFPEREALRVGGRSWTYADLEHWSDRIATALTKAGAKNERIAFIAHKQVASYANILGILKANCAYVPLAPNGPHARWQRMCAMSGTRFSIGEDPRIEGDSNVPVTDTPAPFVSMPPASGQEAYVLFTSGSTGGPKGVRVSRSNVAAYLRTIVSTYEFNENDRFTQFFALTFDLSVHDLFVCWASGGCLCVPTEEAALRSAAFVRDEGITAWFSVPSQAILMQRMRSLKEDAMPSLRHAFFCGEALAYEIATAFANAAPAASLVNLYGPTETTVAITGFEIQRSDPPSTGTVPIGRPFPEHAAVIDGEELCLSGPQVSLGYLGTSASERSAFIPLPGRIGTWYRTGDRVRLDDTGILHYLGRIDDQVKIAGHRVEPAEVDLLIAPLLGGGRSITVPVPEAGALRLVTFIDVPIEPSVLTAYCQQHLPGYMVPFRFITVTSWPLTAHGKTDRSRLITSAGAGPA